MLDCPLCQMISEGKVKASKGKVALLQLGDGTFVAAGCAHTEEPSPSDKIEASLMLFEKIPNGLIRDRHDWPGHWAAEILEGQGIGQSFSRA